MCLHICIYALKYNQYENMHRMTHFTFVDIVWQALRTNPARERLSSVYWKDVKRTFCVIEMYHCIIVGKLRTSNLNNIDPSSILYVKHFNHLIIAQYRGARRTQCLRAV